MPDMSDVIEFENERFHKNSLLGRAYAEAEKQIEEEKYQRAVAHYKERLLRRKWWHRFIPIITITWRK